ncbi:MAG TPA: hypothetical protein VFQ38_10735 [Longimicrobiales bacterium]|nr:hypothetical protein [Longimicrobiales bacterium]
MMVRIGMWLGALLVVSGSAAAQQSPSWVAKASAPMDVTTNEAGVAAVYVAPEVAQAWNYLYRFIDEAEFVLCLEGHENNGVVRIEGFRLAHIEAAGPTSVRYQPCDIPSYVGTAHNHPPASGDPPACYRSVPDRRSFEQDSKAVVDVVLCGEDKWVWMLKDGRKGGTVPQQSPQG